jgi:hypothetical protein
VAIVKKIKTNAGENAGQKGNGTIILSVGM